MQIKYPQNNRKDSGLYLLRVTVPQVSDEPVNCIKVHEQGCLMAVGCNNGNTSLLELSDSLSVSNKCERGWG